MSKPVYNYSIRGIYSTALSKVLLENGQRISKSSNIIKDRFDLSDSYEDLVDVYIDDIPSKNGIECQGAQMAIQTFEKLLIKELEIPFISRPLFNPYTIVKAKVINVSSTGTSILLKNNSIGELYNPQKKFTIDQELLISIIRPVYSMKSKILVSDNLILIGTGISLITDKIAPTYSKNLLADRKKELESIYLPLTDLPFQCSVHFPSSANMKSNEELLLELEKLKQKLWRLVEDFKTASIGQILDNQVYFEEILFTSLDKTKLDQIRNTVIPTLKNHHLWRSMGENESESLTLMEDVLKQDLNLRALLEDVMKENLLTRIQNSKEVEIFHWKPTGVYYKLGMAEVLELSKTHLFLRRISMNEGIYDGLNIKKEINDQMITYIPLENQWWLRHEYYTENKVLKGIYYNINTPIELCSSYISYFDLIVDIIKIPGKPAEIIDISELKMLYSKGIIHSTLYNKIMTLAEQLKQQADNEKISNFFDKKI